MCQHFGWTFDYLFYQIDWHIVQRMLIDAPRYDTTDKGKKKNKVINLEEQTSDDFLKDLL